MIREFDQEIGARLREAREAVGLSQKDLAKSMRADARWSQATVWSIESGERPLRLSEARLVASILECDVAYLAGLDGQPPADGLGIAIRVLEEHRGKVSTNKERA